MYNDEDNKLLVTSPVYHNWSMRVFVLKPMTATRAPAHAAVTFYSLFRGSFSS